MGKEIGAGKSSTFSSLRAGDVTEGNYSEFEKDGTLIAKGDATAWDEISQSFVGFNLFTVAGRVDYNYSELTLDYATNARYPEEPIGMVIQMLHARKAGSDISPHIHWIQNSDNCPNILVEYRWYNNGEAVPTVWTKIALTDEDNVFPFVVPNTQQISKIVLPEGLGFNKTLSSTFDIKIYRDTANTSGLFAGVDTYVGLWSAKYFDIHMEIDMFGSRQEFVK